MRFHERPGSRRPRWDSLRLVACLAFMLSACSGLSGGTVVPAFATAVRTALASPTPPALPCTLLHALSPTPTAGLGSSFGGHGHSTGPAGAPVTIIVFSDYQCTQCALLAASLKQVRLVHANDVHLIYLHTPQPANDKDTLAIQAVEAANLQGKFWEMQDLLFEKLGEWYSLRAADFEAWSIRQAASLGLDVTRFSADFSGATVAGLLARAVQFASSVKSFTPPVLFINSSSPYTGLADFASLDTVIRLDALTPHQFSACPSPSVDPLRQYLAILHLAHGDAVFQLYPDKSPLAVSNFISLAVSGWYEHNAFYRVIPGQLAMTGDPSGTGLGNPGYLFGTEISGALNFDQPGMLAMDNNGPDTNGSRFFVTLASIPQMNGQYTIIGKVLSGLELFGSLTVRDPQPGVYLPPGDELLGVTIEKK